MKLLGKKTTYTYELTGDERNVLYNILDCIVKGYAHDVPEGTLGFSICKEIRKGLESKNDVQDGD